MGLEVSNFMISPSPKQQNTHTHYYHDWFHAHQPDIFLKTLLVAATECPFAIVCPLSYKLNLNLLDKLIRMYYKVYLFIIRLIFVSGKTHIMWVYRAHAMQAHHRYKCGQME